MEKAFFANFLLKKSRRRATTAGVLGRNSDKQMNYCNLNGLTKEIQEKCSGKARKILKREQWTISLVDHLYIWLINPVCSKLLEKNLRFARFNN